MILSKNKLIISSLIYIVIILSLFFLLRIPAFVKLVGKNYIPLCDDLQTKVIEYLYEKIDIKPIDSKTKTKEGKVWKQIILELNLPYKAEISSILTKLKDKFNFSLKALHEDKYYTEYCLYYDSLPIQILKIYREHPKVAIIFDDIGESINQLKEIVRLNVPVTISILPFLNFSKECAILAKKNELEVMLHLPMEPHQSEVTSGVHTITTKMSTDEIIRWTKESIKNIPYLRGVNNHMGSKATESEKVMKEVLEVIKSNNLYFIDSRTSSKSVGFEMARRMDIPTYINRCYLDNKSDKDYIRKRLDLLIKMVLERGEAIAIGHSRKNTIEVIKEYILRFKQSQIRFVYVSDILNKSRR